MTPVSASTPAMTLLSPTGAAALPGGTGEFAMLLGLTAPAVPAGMVTLLPGLPIPPALSTIPVDGTPMPGEGLAALLLQASTARSSIPPDAASSLSLTTQRPPTIPAPVADLPIAEPGDDASIVTQVSSQLAVTMREATDRAKTASARQGEVESGNDDGKILPLPEHPPAEAVDGSAFPAAECDNATTSMLLPFAMPAPAPKIAPVPDGERAALPPQIHEAPPVAAPAARTPIATPEVRAIRFEPIEILSAAPQAEPSSEPSGIAQAFAAPIRTSGIPAVRAASIEVAQPFRAGTDERAAPAATMPASAAVAAPVPAPRVVGRAAQTPLAAAQEPMTEQAPAQPQTPVGPEAQVQSARRQLMPQQPAASRTAPTAAASPPSPAPPIRADAAPPMLAQPFDGWAMDLSPPEAAEATPSGKPALAPAERHPASRTGERPQRQTAAAPAITLPSEQPASAPNPVLTSTRPAAVTIDAAIVDAVVPGRSDQPSRAVTPAIASREAPEHRHQPAAPPVARDAAEAPADSAPLTTGAAAPDALEAPPPATSAPAHSPAAAPRPHDFDTLVSRLADAREAAAPHVVRTAFEHAEFGRVALQIAPDSGGLSVTMSSHDADFASSVQAAAIAVAGAAMGAGLSEQPPDDRGSQQQAQQQPGTTPNSAQTSLQGGNQNPQGQSRADHSGQQQRRDGSSPQHDQREPQPGVRHGDRGRNDREPRSGVYA